MNFSKGTLDELDDAASPVLARLRPTGFGLDTVKRELALYWLQRPCRFWRRLIWAWRLALSKDWGAR